MSRLAPRDVVLLAVSCVPFFVVNTGSARYSSQSAALILIIGAAMCGLAWAKPLYGRNHVIARVLLAASGFWGYAGCFLDASWDVVIPQRMGVLSQYLWYLGIFLLLKSRADYMQKSAESLIRNRMPDHLV